MSHKNCECECCDFNYNENESESKFYPKLTDAEYIEMLRKLSALEYSEEEEKDIIGALIYYFPSILNEFGTPEERLQKAKEANKPILL